MNRLSIRNSEFSISPNPNNGEFKVLLSNTAELPKLITILDYQGKEVKAIANPGNYEYNFNLSGLSSGLYIINAFYKDKTESKRFIKN